MTRSRIVMVLRTLPDARPCAHCAALLPAGTRAWTWRDRDKAERAACEGHFGEALGAGRAA
jgi:hypothetical protein